MEDALTEAPPPSRFFNEDLNNFTPSSPPLPSPFLLFSNPNNHPLLRPSLLIISISSPSLHLLHHISSKTLIGTLILPELSFSGNPIEPSANNKSINIYSLDKDRSVLFVSIQIPILAERSHAVAKLLIDGGKILPNKVLIFDSIQFRNFRGKLSPDETFAFKIETLEQRSIVSIVRGLDYFPSGSVIDGLGASILARCQVKRIAGTLCVSWPESGVSAVLLVKSLLKDLLPNVDFSVDFDLLGFDRIRDSRFDSEMFT